jgi:hypothetical protein
LHAHILSEAWLGSFARTDSWTKNGLVGGNIFRCEEGKEESEREREASSVWRSPASGGFIYSFDARVLPFLS